MYEALPLMLGGVFALGGVCFLQLRRLLGDAPPPPRLSAILDAIGSHHQAADVTRALERFVAGSIPHTRASVVAPDALASVVSASPSTRRRLDIGESVPSRTPQGERLLLVPMRARGALQAVMVVSFHERSPVLSSDEHNALQETAAAGAVALIQASAIEALEQQRERQWRCLQDDRRYAVAALAAECIQDLRSPVSSLHATLTRFEMGAPMSIDDLPPLRDEIDRLDRLAASLGQLKSIEVRPTDLSLREASLAAVELVTPMLPRGVRVDVNVPEHITLHADVSALRVLLFNLLTNAARSLPGQGRIGVELSEAPDALAFEVWDDGRGVPAAEIEQLFLPWGRARGERTELGLLECARITAAHGWQIVHAREHGRTHFKIIAPLP